MTQGMIWHCEDHHPNRAVVYCPVLYHEMLARTFLASDIFQEVPQAVADLLRGQRDEAQRRFREQYPWVFSKKDFLAGRPIVSFVKAFVRPLLEATA